VLFASGRITLFDAIFFLGAPWAVLAAALRPDWLVLALAGLPASLTAVVQVSRLLALVSVALLALVITRPRFSLALTTGLPAMLAIVVAGHIFRANVDDVAQVVNDSAMLLLGYYVALALLAFNLVVHGELSGQRLGTALIIGVGTTLALGLTGYENSWFHGGTTILTRGYLGYLAVGGLGISVARILTRKQHGASRTEWLTTAGLLALTVVSFSRAAWGAAAIAFILLALYSGRRRLALIVPIIVATAFMFPSVRQELASSASGDIADALRTGQITTGRWELWTGLWEHAESALPWGNGFGFMWSLSSEDLFGAEGVFAPGQGHIPAHNDFMLLLVEFGIPGVSLLAFFWILLMRASVRVARSTLPGLALDGLVLIGILTTGFVMASVDNLIAIRPFAERFFLAAGTMFALGRMAHAQQVIDAQLAGGAGPTEFISDQARR
jgi:hypothetical protein